MVKKMRLPKYSLLLLLGVIVIVIIAIIVIVTDPFASFRDGPECFYDSSDYREVTLFGSWVHEDGDDEKGRISFAESTFRLSGIESENFISFGEWSYNEDKGELELNFTDQFEVWDKYFDEFDEEAVLSESTVKVDKERHSITVRIIFGGKELYKECRATDPYFVLFGRKFKSRMQRSDSQIGIVD